MDYQFHPTHEPVRCAALCYIYLWKQPVDGPPELLTWLQDDLANALAPLSAVARIAAYTYAKRAVAQDHTFALYRLGHFPLEQFGLICSGQAMVQAISS